MHPDLTHLQHIDELDTLLAESSHRPLLLFKHSVSCGTSFEALDELIDHLNDERLPARYAMITVQTHRELSTAVASDSACGTRRRRRSSFAKAASSGARRTFA